MVMSFCAVLFSPRGVLDEILNLIESVSEDFPSYSYKCFYLPFECYDMIPCLSYIFLLTIQSTGVDLEI